MTPPVVLAALLVSGALTSTPLPAADSPAPAPATRATAQDIADVPADIGSPEELRAAVDPTVPPARAAGCPAYLGPRCDSREHERYATGQAIAALGLVGT